VVIDGVMGNQIIVANTTSGPQVEVLLQIRTR